MCVLSNHASRLEGGHECTQLLHALGGTEGGTVYMLLRTIEVACGQLHRCSHVVPNQVLTHTVLLEI